MVLQVLAIPVLSFQSWNLYFPSWQEVATTLLPVALGIISISISYRYLPIFPQELELNPPDSPVKEVAEPESQEEAAKASEGEMEPAEA
jgi:molybdopterin-containing oxidoreductase family membrane subunit